MPIDIYQLDKISPEGDSAEEALEAFRDALIEEFLDAPESQGLLDDDDPAGFWAGQLLYYGFGYEGVTVTQMTATNVDTIVTEYFPRKISLLTADDGAPAMPELIAFWRYLQRVYNLPQAPAIIKTLEKIQPNFLKIMNDSAKWGMAKSFVQAGQAASYDMSDQTQMSQFMQLTNAAALSSPSESALSPLTGPWGTLPAGQPKERKVDSTKKKKRKLEKAARKKNRKK